MEITPRNKVGKAVLINVDTYIVKKNTFTARYQH